MQSNNIILYLYYKEIREGWWRMKVSVNRKIEHIRCSFDKDLVVSRTVLNISSILPLVKSNHPKLWVWLYACIGLQITWTPLITYTSFFSPQPFYVVVVVTRW